MRSIIAECKCKNAKTLFQEKDVRYRMPDTGYWFDLHLVSCIFTISRDFKNITAFSIAFTSINAKYLVNMLA